MTALFQNSFYVVNNLNAILYGGELVLFFMTVQQLQLNRKRTSMDKFLIGLSTTQLVLITIYWTTQAYFGQQMWIVHADYPGGMDAYLADFAAVWYQTWGSAAVMLCNLLSDALLIYRLFVIWNNRLIVVFPVILWIAALASAIGLLYESGRPNGNYFVGIATIFGTCFNSTTFAFNVIVTALICGRIISVGRRLTYGDEGTKVYTGPVAIVVESALPFTIFSLAYVITYAMKSDIAVAFSFYSMFTCISPQLITLRVLSRRAWTRESGTRFMTTLNFTDPTGDSDTRTGRVGTHLALAKPEKRASPDPSVTQLADMRILPVRSD